MSYVNKNTPLHGLDAFIKLLSLLLLVTAIILADSIIGYGIVLMMSVVVIAKSGIGFTKALSGVRQLWLFFLVILCMNAWFYESEEVLVSWWIFRLSVEGIIQGLHVVVRTFLIMIYGNILIAVTTPVEITGAFRTMLHPLKYLKVPVQDVAMILGVAIQFVPTFIEEAAMIKKAQTARGAQFESQKLRERAASLLPLVVPMFLSAFRRADELSVAMEARGYRKGHGGTRRRRRLHAADFTALSICVCICVIEIFL